MMNPFDEKTKAIARKVEEHRAERMKKRVQDRLEKLHKSIRQTIATMQRSSNEKAENAQNTENVETAGNEEIIEGDDDSSMGGEDGFEFEYVLPGAEGSGELKENASEDTMYRFL